MCFASVYIAIWHIMFFPFLFHCISICWIVNSMRTTIFFSLWYLQPLEWYLAHRSINICWMNKWTCTRVFKMTWKMAGKSGISPSNLLFFPRLMQPFTWVKHTLFHNFTLKTPSCFGKRQTAFINYECLKKFQKLYYLYCS